MHIVAMAAGYIDSPPAELVMAPRKQVLVAVTSNWQVLCLDHNLKLRWETTILVCLLHMSTTYLSWWYHVMFHELCVVAVLATLPSKYNFISLPICSMISPSSEGHACVLESCSCPIAYMCSLLSGKRLMDP